MVASSSVSLSSKIPPGATKVLLGITGSIAAYRAPDIIRRLQEAGCAVRVVMTHSARQVIGSATCEAISQHPCMGEFWSSEPSSGASISGEARSSEIEHIAWGDWADCVLIAPATADCIAKIRLGIADTPLLATLLAARCPLIIAPAMNCNMWASAPIQEHVAALRDRGIRFVGPEAGSLACGWQGAGRLAEVDAIVAEVARVGIPQDFAGHHIVVTLGPTREKIDPVRYLTNRSSGKMGCAVIAGALARGATVTAIHGPLSVSLPHGSVRSIAVESALEMEEAVQRVVFDDERSPSVVVMAAAVADYRARHPSTAKLKRRTAEEGALLLELEPNPDIIAGVARRRGAAGSPLLVGFAVESMPPGDDLIAEFSRKRSAKGVELLVGNRGEDAFDGDTNCAYLIEGRTDGETVSGPLSGTKREVAEVILDRIVGLLRGRVIAER